MRIVIRDGSSLSLARGEPRHKAGVLEHFRRLKGTGTHYYPMPYGEDKLVEWLERSGRGDFTASFHWLALQGERVVGDLFMRQIGRSAFGLDGVAEIHLSIDRELQGQGLGAAMLAPLQSSLGELLREAGLRRLAGRIFPENGPMLAIALKAGFKLEGVLRRHMRGADGRYHDVLLLAYLLETSNDCCDCQEKADAVVHAHVADLTFPWGSYAAQ